MKMNYDVQLETGSGDWTVTRREVLKGSGLVIAGPLLGDWLNQCVVDWVADDGVLASIEYSNRKASYIGETLRSGGKVLALRPELGEVELEVNILNQADEVIAPGVAVARFHDIGQG